MCQKNQAQKLSFLQHLRPAAHQAHKKEALQALHLYAKLYTAVCICKAEICFAADGKACAVCGNIGVYRLFAVLKLHCMTQILLDGIAVFIRL